MVVMLLLSFRWMKVQKDKEEIMIYDGKNLETLKND